MTATPKVQRRFELMIANKQALYVKISADRIEAYNGQPRSWH
jgi:hypothetical protein